MKIGILTLPLHTNYGGILQAYALQTVLERMGHEARVISLKSRKKPGVIGLIRYYLLSPIKQFILNHLLPAKFSGKQGYYTAKFIQKWIKRDFYFSYYEIPQGRYDAIIVGSDQIWREKYVCGSNKLPIETSFLDFAKNWNVLRISYAASFGTDEWEYNEQQTTNCQKLLENFDAVSVREKSGVTLCQKYLNHDAQTVLDPTLLLSKEDYLMLLGKNRKKQHGILMAYVLDEDESKRILIEHLGEKLGLTIYKANISGIDALDSSKKLVQPPLEDWLAGFDDADFVVTDSFHACVFSIIFNKPFIVVPNVVRGTSRFESLLETFGQKFRIVRDPANFDISDAVLKTPNCFGSTKQKDLSMEFLNKAILK